MANTENRYPIKQMYDENGKPFYPLTHINLINGDKTKLDSVGASIVEENLASYLISPYTGEFHLYILNNLIYAYAGSISYTEAGSPMPHETDIIIARDIPAKFRSQYQIIQMATTAGVKDRLTVWLTEDGKLMGRITPQVVNKDIIYQSDYKSSIKRFEFNGLFFRGTKEEVDNV